MQWEKWDPDVVEVTEAEGGLKDGATFNFVMKKPQGQKIPCTLSDDKKGECLTFSGKSLGGLLKVAQQPTELRRAQENLGWRMDAGRGLGVVLLQE